ncbi:dmt(drug/metabolite transporter) superfamily permease [Salinarchaeum sp. Harcht-Bsk1]|uniref:DMT family transporter n=1 Tax=Salinarchaeum sp. Harcht-Bsk1 TaxID=1333523 RepID=UPI00034246BC|nr:DMT family transporter [Salinarchaeum sp. Harcht-Bsk1]AGN01376.1 dmt(drug/metabolite transporter) superfamily permease [Salinarchaeum sp. Harcht-Bsk1]
MSRVRTLLLFALVTLIFGTAFPAVKAGLAYFPPLLFASIRNYVAGLLLLAYVGATATYRVPVSRADWTAVIAGGAFLIGGVGFGFVGQQYITSGVAAVIFSLSPIVIAVLAWVLLPAERLTGRDYVGVVLGFLGVAIVVRPDPAALLDPELVGKLLVFTGVVVIALGTVLVRRSEPALPVPALTGWAMLLGATLQFCAALAVGESIAAIDVTPAALLTIGYLGLFVGAIGFVSYLTLMGTVGALNANLTTYLTPVVALVVGWAALGEDVAVLTLLGFGVIAAGFAVLQRRELYAELASYRGLYR